jgi:hypothetical protein
MYDGHIIFCIIRPHVYAVTNTPVLYVKHVHRYNRVHTVV